MKNNKIIFLLTTLIILICSQNAFADGQSSTWNQQSYPVPQLYPIGDQSQIIQNIPVYTKEYQEQMQNQYQYQYQYQNQQNCYSPYPYYYQAPTPTPTPQPYYSPYYDPYSNMYFYPIYNSPDNSTYFYPIDNNPQPYYYQPTAPSGQDYNVYVYKQWNYDGSVKLTWSIRNITNENWARSNIDIRCNAGCHLLTDPSRTLWDIPYTVNRGEQLTFTVNIWQPLYGETMTFSLVAGSKTIYTFNVNPN